MAIQREIWQEHIVEKLYAANPHLKLCVNADQYVLQGKVVHIPNAGSAPGVTKNRTTLPANVTRRTDIDITYALDEYTSDPVLITNAEDAELSYDKRVSVLADTQLKLNDIVGVNTLYNWASDRIVRTSGDNIKAHLTDSVGLRKKFTVADLEEAETLMNEDGLPLEGRYAIMDARMLQQLRSELSATDKRDFSEAVDPKTGIIGKLYGFNIITRSSALRYNGSAAVAPETKGAGADSAAVLCWHISAVEKAEGDVVFFEDTRNPQYYGDIYSALVRMGGRIRRYDKKGVIAIVQDYHTVAWKKDLVLKVGDYITHEDDLYMVTEAHTAGDTLDTDKVEKIV